MKISTDYLVVAAAFVLAAAACFLVGDLNVTSDNRVFYHEENPRLLELLDVEEAFELYSNVTFLIVSEEELNRNSSEAIRWLSREVEGYQGYVRHHSLDNYPHLTGVEDSIEVMTVLEAACPGPTHCESLKNSKNYPELEEIKNRLISDSFSSFAVTAVVDIEIGDNLSLEKLTNQIEQTLVDFGNNFPKLQLAYTGAIPMMQAFADASNRDLSKLFPISAITMALVSTMLFGSIRFALCAVTCSIINVLWIMGFASFLGLAINSATSTLPLALLVISISSSAHLICYISLRRKEDGNSNKDYTKLVTQAAIANRSPILLASLTTCIGLATLSFVQIPPFREFGLLAALGTITNYFIVTGLLPALLRTIPERKTVTQNTRFYGFIHGYARYIDAGKLPIKTVLVFLAVASLGLIKFSVNEDYIKYFDESHRFRIGADLLIEKLASPYSIDIALDLGTPSAALLPENLVSLKRFQEKIASDPAVVNALSIVQHLDSARRAFGSSQKMGNSLESSDYIQQLYLAYELSLPVGHSTNELIDADHQRVRISLLLGEASTSTLVELEQRIEQLWENSAADFPKNSKIVITGETLPLAHLSKESLKEVSISVAACLILLFVGAMVFTKSIALANISVLSVIAPLAVAFGSWAWYGVDFGLATAIVIAVTIGILVDDAIHFLHRYRSGRLAHQLSADSAISYAVHHAAAGIIASSLILVSGFLILCFSSFAVNQQFGTGVSLTIASALILTLVGLPAALSALKPHLN